MVPDEPGGTGHEDSHRVSFSWFWRARADRLGHTVGDGGQASVSHARGDANPRARRTGPRRRIGAALLGLFLAAPAPAVAGDRDLTARLADLRPGHWLEITSNADGTIPDTHLARVFPPRAGHPAWGVSGPAAVIKAWGGAAYDTKRRRLILAGGGHGDYGGNEVYAFDLDRLEWSRLTEPSALDAEDDTTDGTPVARHTYDGMEYLPDLDRVLMFGGSLYRDGAARDSAIWHFHPDSALWQRGAKAPLTGWPSAAVDPRTGHYFVHVQYSLLEYRPAENRWIRRGPREDHVGEGAAAIDPIGNRFYLLASGKLWYYTLDRLVTLYRRRADSFGDTGVERLHGAGLDYDPIRRRLVAWDGGRAVWSLDPAALEWIRHPNPDGPAPVGTVVQYGKRHPISNGVFGRWRYVPGADVFIGVNGAQDNVWVYRMPGLGAVGTN